MISTVKHSLLVTTLLICLWLPSHADTAAPTPPASASPAGADVHAKDAKSDTTQQHRTLPLRIDMVPEKDRCKLPLPIGLSWAYFTSSEQFLFHDVSLALNGQPLPPQMVTLHSVYAVQTSNTLRADAWILPFLDLHAFAGSFDGKAKNIQASAAIPLPLPLQIPFNGNVHGIGATLAGSKGPIFFSYDWTLGWANVNVIDNTVRTITQGPRVGMMFNEKHNRVDLFVGAFNEQVLGHEEGNFALQGMGQLHFNVSAVPAQEWNYLVGAHGELLDKNVTYV